MVSRQRSSPRSAPGVEAVPLNSSQPVSELFVKLSSGESEGLSAVLPLVYDELRKIAHRYLRNERLGHTLQSTALVHEAYLRLKKQDAGQFENRVALCSDFRTIDEADSCGVRSQAARGQTRWGPTTHSGRCSPTWTRQAYGRCVVG